MPPQEVLAFAAPGTEEMTKTAIGLVGAGMTGVVEGVITKVAPQLGALEVPFTWATLLGIPAVGVAGALFSRGMISDLLKGVAAGGTAILAYTLPALLAPDLFGGKGQRELTVEQKAAIAAGRDVKLLTSGIRDGPKRAQEAVAKSILSF